MKKIYSILIIIVSALMWNGCSKVLDPDPRSSYTELDAWASLENTNYYVNGFYKPMHEYGAYGNRYSGVGMSDGLTDILKYNSSGSDGFGGDLNKVVFNGTISPAGNPLSSYDDLYNRIRRINEFLYGLDKYTNYSAEENAKLTGQARFMRAYLYFLLMRAHGSLIIRDRLDGPNEASKPRSSAGESWDFIVSDLDYAAQNLPDQWDAGNLGRITKGAAYGFMSRVLLYAERWQAAAEAAQKVIDKEGSLYGLMDNYADAFNIDDNKEVVMAFRFGGQIGHMFNRFYTPPSDTELSFKSYASPTQELVDSYKMADGSKFNWDNPAHAANPYANREPRFYASILYNGASWKGRIIETFVGGKDGIADFGNESMPSTTTTGYYIRKLLDEKLTNITLISTMDWKEIRYAEVLLNHAEAMNEAGNVTEALKSLNKLRSRAKLPAITESNNASLRLLIRDERKVELAFEGHRYWDLRRWRNSMEVLAGKRMHGIKITKNQNGTFNYHVVDVDKKNRYFEERYYQLPIPLSEIRNNPAATQIEGW